jgi:hypothetical protein
MELTWRTNCCDIFQCQISSEIPTCEWGIGRVQILMWKCRHLESDAVKDL